MAKRALKKPAAVADDKVRFEVRFDKDVSDKVYDLAESVGISVNQLAQGVLRWAVNHAHLGEAAIDQHGTIGTRPMVGCVWFGQEPHVGKTVDGEPVMDPGYVAFSLDFTERRVVLEGQKPQVQTKGKVRS